MSDLYLHFEAADGLFEGGLAKPDQPERVTLGPFPDYVQLTYESVRVGPEGEHVAAYDVERGVWQLVDEGELDRRDSAVFSDVVISTTGA
jgi:hypothetical protein